MTYDGLSAAIIRNSRDAEAVPRSAIRRVNPVVRLPLLTAPTLVTADTELAAAGQRAKKSNREITRVP